MKMSIPIIRKCTIPEVNDLLLMNPSLGAPQISKIKYLLVLFLLEFCSHTILHDMIVPDFDRLHDDE